MSFRFINGYLEIDYIRVAQLLSDWRDCQDKIEAAFEDHYEGVHSGQYDSGYEDGYKSGEDDEREGIVDDAVDFFNNLYRNNKIDTAQHTEIKKWIISIS